MEICLFACLRDDTRCKVRYTNGLLYPSVSPPPTQSAKEVYHRWPVGCFDWAIELVDAVGTD